jgi:hypothetical protein
MSFKGFCFGTRIIFRFPKYNNNYQRRIIYNKLYQKIDVNKKLVAIKDFQAHLPYKSSGNLVYKHIGKKEGYSRQVRKIPLENY